MNSGRFSAVRHAMREIMTYFIPKIEFTSTSKSSFENKAVTVIIPTYKPKNTTYRIINQIVSYHRNASVIVVNDGTPADMVLSGRVFAKINSLAQKNPRQITVLQTPRNLMKANALNFGLDYIFSQTESPDVIITADDDVAIARDTLPILVDTLYANPKTGVVCSQASVKNKTKNLLTRLQSLEYHGFNITKTSDNGFLLGPLVMHGMLSAFRFQAMKKVGGFDAENLIEDYDITVRIKKAGWQTAFVPYAKAWTQVPETLGDLWRQRIRWSYGGLIVVYDFWRDYKAVFHDLVGHFLFIALLALIVLSFLITGDEKTSPLLVALLLITAMLYYLASYIYNTATLLTYRERDRIDWVIKLTIIPEFVYSNMLSAILIGSYLYFLFNAISFFAVKQFPMLTILYKAGTRTFRKFGYSKAWGTRAS